MAKRVTITVKTEGLTDEQYADLRKRLVIARNGFMLETFGKLNIEDKPATTSRSDLFDQLFNTLHK